MMSPDFIASGGGPLLIGIVFLVFVAGLVVGWFSFRFVWRRIEKRARSIQFTHTVYFDGEKLTDDEWHSLGLAIHVEENEIDDDD